MGLAGSLVCGVARGYTWAWPQRWNSNWGEWNIPLYVVKPSSENGCYWLPNTASLGHSLIKKVCGERMEERNCTRQKISRNKSYVYPGLQGPEASVCGHSDLDNQERYKLVTLAWEHLWLLSPFGAAYEYLFWRKSATPLFCSLLPFLCPLFSPSVQLPFLVCTHPFNK